MRLRWTRRDSDSTSVIVPSCQCLPLHRAAFVVPLLDDEPLEQVHDRDPQLVDDEVAGQVRGAEGPGSNGTYQAFSGRGTAAV